MANGIATLVAWRKMPQYRCPMSDVDVLVVGAGVVGLTTAICLAETGKRVRVVTAEPSKNTTSVVAGALWGPGSHRLDDRSLAWVKDSLTDFQRLAEQPNSGVRIAPVFAASKTPIQSIPPEAAIIPRLLRCPPDELPAGFRDGFHAMMPIANMPVYFDYLENRLISAGGTIEIRRIDRLAEVTNSAPTVVNCAGLAARELAEDRGIRPIRGQHVILTNPGLDEGFFELSPGSEWISYFTHSGRVVCGGNAEPDDWRIEPDPALTERIVQRCQAIQPRLLDAEIIEVLVGLRPDRPTVRLESETIDGTELVHNYGHGGSGVSLSWGCARSVLALIDN